MSERAHRPLPAPPDRHLPPHRTVEGRAEARHSKPQARVFEIQPSLPLDPAASRRRPVECLPRSLLNRLIADAAGESYDAVSILGGELALGAGLADALTLAKEFGLATALTTDLVPLSRRRLDRLASVLDAMAVTLYGAPQSHDRIRAKAGAFRAMAARLPALRAAGIPFGFTFSLTDANLGELPWVTRFALEEGAKLLQIAPAGRGCGCGEIAVTTAWLAFLRLRERVGDRMSIGLDLVRGDRSHSDPRRDGAAPMDHSADHSAAHLADLVGTLVVEADGSVVPLRRGFPRRYALGNLRFARLPVLASRWRSNGGYARFYDYSKEILRAAASPAGFNWFQAVAGPPAPPTRTL
ncbi:MAG: hypothetical protein ACREET_07830 [Stellaceae bacterium]